MYYLTHAIEEIRKSSALASELTIGQSAISCMLDLFERGTPFLLPAGNHLNIEVKSEAFKFLCLPYPATMLEYPIDVKAYKVFNRNEATGATHESSKRCALLLDQSAIDTLRPFNEAFFQTCEGIKGFYICSLFYADDVKEWNISTSIAFISTEESDDNYINPDPDKRSTIGVRMTSLYPELTRLLQKKGMTPEQVQSIHEGDLIEDIVVSIKALACLSAKNIKSMTLPAPEALNRKRIKNGKKPFCEYKILDIFIPPNVIVKEGKVKEEQKLHHALTHWASEGMKVHTVRAHFKTRATGIFKWNSFVRGSSEKGEVRKAYRLKDKPS